MIAAIFEVELIPGQQENYFSIAADLRPLLHKIDGFISIERFQSLSNSERLLSLSLWRDEDSLQIWRNAEAHREAQEIGKAKIFENYRIIVTKVIRDYGMKQRPLAPRAQ